MLLRKGKGRRKGGGGVNDEIVHFSMQDVAEEGEGKEERGGGGVKDDILHF